MERLKSITIIFLLAVGLLNSIAPPICFANRSSGTKSASVLLQEGLYAEEIEGDLDAAIKIYEQVIAQAKDTQRAAAQATYRIGMCYLKKGEKAKAAQQFRELISKFPKQQALGTRAREQLAKLKPPASGFGPVGPVPVEQLIKSGKVPAFKTQIYDNTGLDLETGVVAPLKDEWPALFDVTWDNDGGGALMINPKSSVRFLALGAAEKWGDAISMARNTLAVLRTSNARGMLASQSKFVAILTSEGNLAVVQIGDHNAQQATLYWWVEEISSFGPVIERVVNDDGERKNIFIDLDSGELFSAPRNLRSKESQRWFVEKGIDAGCETNPAGPGLWGLDMVVIPLNSEYWQTVKPGMLRSELASGKPGSPAVMSGLGQLPASYMFKTREGGMGVLQILEVRNDVKPRHIKIRYKMLQERAKTVAVGWRKVFLPDADTRGVNAILDLASGELLPAGEGEQQLTLFRELGKGDLAYDRFIICLRGAVAKLRKKDELTKLTKVEQIEDLTAYQLPSAPCRLLVTTTEGDKYDVTVLSVSGSGLYLEYKILAEPAEVASVASFGPTKVARLYDIDHPTTTEKECAIDFDTGKLSKIPPQARQMPGDDLMKWLSGSGTDAVAEIAGKDRGLIGVDVAVKTMPPYVWDKISPTELRALMVNNYSARQETTPMLLEDEDQQVFAFRTRDSGLGILQILDVDKSKQMVQFRYKMLQGETAQVSVSSHKVFLPECDTTVYDLLDLASSRIINSEPGGEVLDLSKPDGKGNLYFDKADGQLWLVGLRGTRMRLRSGGELLSSEPDFIARGRNAYYLLGEIPCQYLVTTAQGDKYELKVLSMDAGDRPGVHIEYWKSAESPGAFDVATGVRGDAAKAMEFLSGLKVLMFGVVGAVESDDPNTALLLLDKLIAQSKQFKSTVKDTSVEAAVKAGLEMLDPLRDALEKKQMGRAKSLLAALNQMGPAVESALEKEAAQRGQSKKRTDIRRR